MGVSSPVNVCYCRAVGENAHTDSLWAQMPVLLALSRSGTLDGAAEHLCVNRTTVSRRLKLLERSFGGRLFDSVDGDYQLTALGRELLAAAEAAETHLMSIEGTAPVDQELMAGPLRIAVAPHLMPVAAPAMISLAGQMPKVRFQINSSYALHEIEARQADIALRIMRGPPIYPLVGRKLKNLRGAIYKKKGLRETDFVQIIREDETQIPRKSKTWPADAQLIEIDDICGQQELMAAGGIGRLPIFMGDNDNRLERVAGLLPDAGWKLWLISHQAFKSSRRIKAMSDELARFLAENKKI